MAIYNKTQADGYTQVSLGSVLVATEDIGLNLGIIFDDNLPANDAEPQISFFGYMVDKLYPGTKTCYIKVLNSTDRVRKFTALDVS